MGAVAVLACGAVCLSQHSALPQQNTDFGLLQWKIKRNMSNGSSLSLLPCKCLENSVSTLQPTHVRSVWQGLLKITVKTTFIWMPEMETGLANSLVKLFVCLPRQTLQTITTKTLFFNLPFSSALCGVHLSTVLITMMCCFSLLGDWWLGRIPNKQTCIYSPLLQYDQMMTPPVIAVRSGDIVPLLSQTCLFRSQNILAPPLSVAKTRGGCENVTFCLCWKHTITNTILHVKLGYKANKAILNSY